MLLVHTTICSYVCALLGLLATSARAETNACAEQCASERRNAGAYLTDTCGATGIYLWRIKCEAPSLSPSALDVCIESARACERVERGVDGGSDGVSVD